ncbi:ferrochelatase [Aestuariicella sp. G3-2]|uniref:ferrochelatase n=1 Tax=Pseudomaricurvus albidus TaxID=2842452 RepID=UPI001C0C6BA9|nr:ferrochelatase [Aestuariicella albida]MBU3071123.1 ferrochelatase [Aestuariicella albida]
MKSDKNTRLGVVLMNLGTPVEPTPKAVRQFLEEFLGDRRVVEIPRLIWWPILYGIILPFRSPKVARLYKEIWLPEGSPLKVITEKQVDALQSRFSSGDVQVTYAMTYGAPKLEQRISELESSGVDKIVVLPLYPQYSATTTAAIYDQFAKLIVRQRNISNVTIHKEYYSRRDYIIALANSVRRHWEAGEQSEKLLFSFHGIPKRCVDKGDPYELQSRKTAQLVAEELGLVESQWAISFQSRLGKAEWLKPYTDLLLESWGREGVESVDVLCPAFASDCLETVEEIDKENREIFLSSGGKRFEYIPCLNDSVDHIDLLEKIVTEYRI